MLKNPKNIVLSFSVNTPNFIAKYERGTAKVEDRLKSAKIAKERGFEVRLRIDPMVPMDNWKEDYSKLVKDVLKVNPDRITLGTLRYFNGLESWAKRDGRNTDIFKYGTEQTKADGRIRVMNRGFIYKFIIKELLMGGYPLDKIGLCKETDNIFKFLDQEGLKLNKKTCNCTI